MIHVTVKIPEEAFHYSICIDVSFVFLYQTTIMNNHRGVAKNFMYMLMKPANNISDISAEAQHFLQDCI